MRFGQLLIISEVYTKKEMMKIGEKIQGAVYIEKLGGSGARIYLIIGVQQENIIFTKVLKPKLVS